jgi:hypothetical protein
MATADQEKNRNEIKHLQSFTTLKERMAVADWMS